MIGRQACERDVDHARVRVERAEHGATARAAERVPMSDERKRVSSASPAVMRTRSSGTAAHVTKAAPCAG